MFLSLYRLCKETRGTTAIEYALIASLISIALISAALAIGTSLSAMFDEVSSSFNS